MVYPLKNFMLCYYDITVVSIFEDTKMCGRDCSDCKGQTILLPEGDLMGYLQIPPLV